MRKTKIVSTIGPASESPEILKQLIEAGINVARLNFSHGDFDEHGKRIKNIRRVSKDLNTEVAIMLDTKGPEIRTGDLKEDSVQLKAGNTLTLTTEQILGDESKIAITYDKLPADVNIGSTILLNDGLIELTVTAKSETEIECRIVNGGEIRSRRGVNVPGVRVSLPGITDKDAKDIVFGIEQEVDFIAASFVRKAEDVLEIRQLLEEHGAGHVQIISKIENQEGLDNLDEIIEVSDGIMVARGDLGVEIPSEEVPLVQKQMIEKCNLAGKPVITATQMLDSMERNPRPTRAEASDVANAIFDGSDAVMLSGETAAGNYPVEAVLTMARIAEKAESGFKHRDAFQKLRSAQQTLVTESISQSVARSALELKAKAIITATHSGYTARMVSKYRPHAPVIAVTPEEHVMRRLQLVWGVFPVKAKQAETTDEMFQLCIDRSIETGLVTLGDLVVITAGVPVGRSGTTNLIKVHHVGELIAKGQGIGTQSATGRVVVAETAEEALRKTTENAVLVCRSTDKHYIPAIEKASALITETGGITSHAAVVGLSLGIPVIVGVDQATKLLEDDMRVSVYGEKGVIYSGQPNVL